MNPAELYRANRPGAVARDAAQGEYLAMFARLAVDGEKVAAMIALVACRAESRAEASPDPPWCPCASCQAHLFGVRWARLTGVSL